MIISQPPNLNTINLDIRTSRDTHRTYPENQLNTMDGTNGANGTSTGSKLLWKHPSPQSTPMYQFLELVNKTHGLQLCSYQELYQWSIENTTDFWQRAWDFVGIRHQGTPSSVSLCQNMRNALTYQD
jgi:hypothetical protein